MKKKSITIQLENGLEARPIAMLVQVASRYESSIYIETGEKKVNAKSIMGMMSLILKTGDRGERALHELEYFSYIIIFRLPVKPVASAFAAGPYEESGTDKILDDDLQIFF